MYFREDPNSAVNYMAKVALCFISATLIEAVGLGRAIRAARVGSKW